MVVVIDAFAVRKGKGSEGPPTSALVNVGSIAQKGPFFNVIATKVTRGNLTGQNLIQECLFQGEDQ